MILKELLKDIKIPIAILMFTNNNKLYTQEYVPKQFKGMSKELLKMEVMDTNLEEDCMEVWVK